MCDDGGASKRSIYVRKDTAKKIMMRRIAICCSCAIAVITLPVSIPFIEHDVQARVIAASVSSMPAPPTAILDRQVSCVGNFAPGGPGTTIVVCSIYRTESSRDSIRNFYSSLPKHHGYSIAVCADVPWNGIQVDFSDSVQNYDSLYVLDQINQDYKLHLFDKPRHGYTYLVYYWFVDSTPDIRSL